MESREMDSPRQDLIEGRNAIREALRAERPIDKIYVNRGSDDPALGRIIRDARAADIPVVEVDRRKLDEMSVTRSHQGVIGVAAAAAYSDIDGIFALAEERGEPPFIVLLRRDKRRAQPGRDNPLRRVRGRARGDNPEAAQRRAHGRRRQDERRGSRILARGPRREHTGHARGAQEARRLWVYGAAAEGRAICGRRTSRGPSASS